MGCAIGLALEYFECRACGCVWLDDPRSPEAWRCPSCGGAGLPLSGAVGGGDSAYIANWPAPQAGGGGLPKVVKDDSKCTNCGTCVEVCPSGVYEKQGDKVVVVNPDACVLCQACVAQCPAQALAVQE